MRGKFMILTPPAICGPPRGNMSTITTLHSVGSSSDYNSEAEYNELHDSRSSTLEVEDTEAAVSDSEYSPRSCEFDLESLDPDAESPVLKSVTVEDSSQIKDSNFVAWSISDDEAVVEEQVRRIKHNSCAHNLAMVEHKINETQRNSLKRTLHDTSEDVEYQHDQKRLKDIETSILTIGKKDRHPEGIQQPVKGRPWLPTRDAIQEGSYIPYHELTIAHSPTPRKNFGSQNSGSSDSNSALGVTLPEIRVGATQSKTVDKVMDDLPVTFDKPIESLGQNIDRPWVFEKVSIEQVKRALKSPAFQSLCSGYSVSQSCEPHVVAAGVSNSSIPSSFGSKPSGNGNKGIGQPGLTTPMHSAGLKELADICTSAAEVVQTVGENTQRTSTFGWNEKNGIEQHLDKQANSKGLQSLDENWQLPPNSRVREWPTQFDWAGVRKDKDLGGNSKGAAHDTSFSTPSTLQEHSPEVQTKVQKPVGQSGKILVMNGREHGSTEPLRPLPPVSLKDIGSQGNKLAPVDWSRSWRNDTPKISPGFSVALDNSAHIPGAITPPVSSTLLNTEETRGRKTTSMLTGQQKIDSLMNLGTNLNRVENLRQLQIFELENRMRIESARRRTLPVISVIDKTNALSDRHATMFSNTASISDTVPTAQQSGTSSIIFDQPTKSNDPLLNNSLDSQQWMLKNQSPQKVAADQQTSDNPVNRPLTASRGCARTLKRFINISQPLAQHHGEQFPQTVGQTVPHDLNEPMEQNLEDQDPREVTLDPNPLTQKLPQEPSQIQNDILRTASPKPDRPSQSNIPNGIWVRTITSPEGETTTVIRIDKLAMDYKNGIEVTTTTVKTATEVKTTTVTSMIPVGVMTARKESGEGNDPSDLCQDANTN